MSRRRKSSGFLAVLLFVLAFVNPRRNAFASAERRVEQIKRQGWKQLAAESRRRKRGNKAPQRTDSGRASKAEWVASRARREDCASPRPFALTLADVAAAPCEEC